MDTEESLKHQVTTAEDLHTVVKTMKAMAAVSIRQFEDAVDALAGYNRAVELGLQAVLRNRPRTHTTRPSPDVCLGAVVFGSDQGMCGPLNDQIAAWTLESLAATRRSGGQVRLLALGTRVATRLADAGLNVDDTFPMAHSTTAIPPLVQDVLLKLDAWHRDARVDRVELFYTKRLSGASCRQETVHLLPVDSDWLDRLEAKPWPTRALPAFRMNWNALFSALVREYLFISLHRAFAESLASENASRLAAMQGAERNIEERIGELTARFHRCRQMTITEELLDIAGGFEALRDDTTQGSSP